MKSSEMSTEFFTASAKKHQRLLKCIERKFGIAGRQEIVQFAELLGVSEGAVKKWIYLERRPRYATMKQIERLTNGYMSLKDW